MSYANQLLGSVNTWASAYLQFETGRLREDFDCYAFVEDEDDKSLYQLALTSNLSICYLGCGGKTGVIQVFEKLQQENKDRPNLFFVDRDTESEPFVWAEEILRTTGYSLESHVCETDHLIWMLGRKLSPSLPRRDCQSVGLAWDQTVVQFKSILSRHSALCQTAAKLGMSLDLGKVDFLSDRTCSDGVVYPGPNADAWFVEKVRIALGNGADAFEINARVVRFSSSNTHLTAQGKALFKLLRVFVDYVLARLGRTFRGDKSSARFWLEAMPWTSVRLNYIREYAERRSSLG